MRSPPNMRGFSSLPREVKLLSNNASSAESERPTRLEVIMVRANQSGHINKSQSLCAGAAPTYETDGDIGSTLRNRDNDLAGNRTDELRRPLTAFWLVLVIFSKAPRRRRTEWFAPFAKCGEDVLHEPAPACPFTCVNCKVRGDWDRIRWVEFGDCDCSFVWKILRPSG
jgi:hypothetical protein